MNQVYITKSKLDAILSKVEISENIFTDFYQLNLGKILSKPEIKRLSAYKMILGSPSALPKYKGKKYQSSDDSRLVYKNSAPAYHLNKTCEKLSNNYHNFEIPPEITSHQCDDYRSFFNEHRALYDEKYDVYIARLEIHFKVKIHNLNEIKHDNSEVDTTVNFESMSKDQINQKLLETLHQMEAFRTKDNETKNLINRFGYATHKAHYHNQNSEWVRYIDTKDNAVYYWHEKKKYIKDLIKQHFIVSINPELQFDGSVLEAMGFHECAYCKAKLLTHEEH